MLQEKNLKGDTPQKFKMAIFKNGVTLSKPSIYWASSVHGFVEWCENPVTHLSTDTWNDRENEALIVSGLSISGSAIKLLQSGQLTLRWHHLVRPRVRCHRFLQNWGSILSGTNKCLLNKPMKKHGKVKKIWTSWTWSSRPSSAAKILVTTLLFGEDTLLVKIVPTWRSNLRW